MPHELTISPQRRLFLRETSAETEGRALPKPLLDTYDESAARGMLASAATTLPASFEFARSIARLYLSELCRAVLAEPEKEAPKLPPPSDDLDRVVLQAPPMTGLEYLNAEVLADWWRDLDAVIREEVARRPDGAPAYLREHDP